MEDYKTLNKKAEELKELRNDLFNNIGACNNIISVLKKHHLDAKDMVEHLKWTKKKEKEISNEFLNISRKIEAIREKCDHDFKYDEETYGGNFSIYVCKKCGKIEWRN